MTDFRLLKKIETWRTALGLLPVPLRDRSDNEDRFILLNGTTGNFCLDFLGGLDRASRCSAAWSSDVGHYVTIDESSVVVNRWDVLSSEERYSLPSVYAQLHQFQRHLDKTAPDRSRSVIVHVLRVFRQIRSAVTDEFDGRRSLQVLLHLLASAAAGERRIVADLEAWGLASDAAEPALMIPDATWDSLLSDLLGTGRYDILRPDIALILRHASGLLFQEAHLQIEVPMTKWLPGLEQPARLRSDARAQEIGIYFTPPALARTLAEEAVRGIESSGTNEVVIFDPACGSGELLKECLRLLKLRGHQGLIRVLGWDKSASSIDMARFVLTWEGRSWTPGQIAVSLSRADSVTAPTWPTNVDILVMNPPFLSWQEMSSDDQEAVSQVLGTRLRNKPNLAMAFAIRALTSLKDGGVLAMIAPSSLLEASSGKDVRGAIAEKLSPLLVAKFGDQNIFSRALVDAGAYVGKRKATAERGTAILWAGSHPNSLPKALRALRRWRGAEATPLTDDGFAVYMREDVGLTGTPWVARSYKAWSNFERVRQSKRTLAARKIFDIKQGVRLGNDVFIVSKEYWGKLDPNEQRFFRPAVMNPSVVNGILSDAYYIFYPYTSGIPRITTENDLERHLPTYSRELLLPAKPKLASRRSLGKSRSLQWWDLLWHRTWLEQEAPRLVSKYFGGARSFAFDKKGSFVVVVGNAWLIKKGAIALGITDEEVYLAMLAYLNSALAESLLQYVSVQVSGGQWDLSNRYVGETLVPNLAKLTDPEVSELVTVGTKISEGTVEWDEVDELLVNILNK